MKIFIEVPTWLGDAVMTTPAIENIIIKYPQAKMTLFGSFLSTEALKKHPSVEKIFIDDSKKAKIRFLALYKLAQSLGAFDLAFSFRRTLTSRLFLFFVKAKQKFAYKRYDKKQKHQVLRYNDFVNNALKIGSVPSKMKLYYSAKMYKRPTLGINPGASYGSAKRWYPDRFAEVAKALSSDYDIVIFGGPSEVDMAHDIEEVLKKSGEKNVTNIAGKTSVGGLIEHIAGLSLFVTGDSGPMHVAAAYHVPTVSLFGPTKHIETSQWMNKKSRIIRHDIDCAPCMKRTCPIRTHECMKLIEVGEVIAEVKML